MTPARGAGGLASIVALLMSAPAWGATVSVTATPDPDSKIGEILREDLRVSAGPGERNGLQVRLTSSGMVRVDDVLTPVVPGPGCTKQGPDGARCEVNDLKGAVIDLGDGNDGLLLSGSLGGPFVTPTCGGYITVDDGPGNDTVTGGRDSERYLNRSGDDTFDGARGDDVFMAGPGADRVLGGEGDDVACYRDRSGGVRLSLDGRANDGRRGERDSVGSDIEVLVGGRGNDRLRGRAGPQKLLGGRGNDRLRGGPGHDVLRAGRGRDRILARDGSVDSIFCSDRPGSIDLLSLDAVDRTKGCSGR